MAYATDADLLARVPPAADVDPAQRAIALEDAAFLVTDDFDAIVPAHVYLAAHLLAVRLPDWEGGGGESGPVTSARAGEIAATFASMAAESDLDSTRWGRLAQRFLPQHFGVTG